jgi:hypothetical protein
MSLESIATVSSWCMLQRVLCPSSLTLNLSRFDSPQHHLHRSIYANDCDYLRVHPKRNRLLRESNCGEFDYGPSTGPFMETYPKLQFQSAQLPDEIMRRMSGDIPRLWVLVTKLAIGVHQVTTIYRGNPFWKIVERDAREIAYFDSDEDMLPVLAEIQKREGFDLKAWEVFEKKYLDAITLDAVKRISGDSEN